MISVIITAYNVEKYVKQAIESVLSQSFENLECIVVLDCPTDKTEEVVTSINDKRISLVKNNTNVGAGLSRRIGVQHSKGEHILFLDGDDWLEPDFLGRLHAKAVETDADIVSGGVTIRYVDGSYEIQCCGDYVSEGYDKVVKFWGQKTVFMNNRLIKRSMFDKVLYSHRRYIEDTPTIIPMLWYANKVVYIDEVGYNYRMNPESLTHTSDFFKEFVFKGLCYCDLIEFFNKKDPKMYKYLDIRTFANIIFQQMQNHHFTTEEINRYPAEWAELMMRLSNLICITQIKFK